MKFDMNRTWNNCVSLLQANFQLLAVLAGVFILIPNVIFHIAAPGFMLAAGEMGADQDRLLALMQENAGSLIGFGLLALIGQFIGYAALVALMGGNRPTVGEALRQALSAIPTLIGVTLLMLVSYLVAGLALALVVGIIGGLLALVAGPAAAAVVGFLALVLVFAAVFYILARFIMVYPAVMLEGVTSPVAAIKRSLELTKPHGKRIFLFLALLMIAYIVISIVVGLVFGLLIASLETGPAAALASGMVNGLLGSLVAIFYASIMVAMHKQLTGSSSAETFD